MGSGYNPLLPGEGITPKQSPETAQPAFEKAANPNGPSPESSKEYFNEAAGVPIRPITTPSPQQATPHFNEAAKDRKVYQTLTPRLTPDGSPIVQSRAEDQRQLAIKARGERIAGQIENDGGKAKDMTKLRRDFDAARDISR